MTLGDSRAHIDEGDPLPPDDRLPGEPPVSIEQVYRAERPRLLRFLRKRSSAPDPDDLVQQSFVQVLEKASLPGSHVRSLEGQLFRIARNLSINQGKSAHGRARLTQVSIDKVDLQAPDLIAALEARDMLNRLEAVIRRMKPRTREIFLAHRIDGYSYGDIAARTGLSVKGVEKHMSRAIATIDRNMGRR